MHERMRRVLVVLTAVISPLAAVSILPAIFLPGMLGLGQAHGDSLTTAAVVTVMSFPLVCAASIAGSWLLWRGNRVTAACATMVLPPLGILILLILMLWLSY